MPDPAFLWNTRSARYADAASGRFVPRLQVRQALDTAIDRSASTVKALSESLRSGAVSLADWQLRMAREIKSAHVAAAALARGGFAQMAPADYGRAGQKIRMQYQFLARFAAQVASGQQPRDGTLPQRAALYIQAARGTYHATQSREMELRGVAEERSIRSARDSCSDCVAAEAAGWAPLGTLAPIGERLCGANCRCSMDYRGTDAA